MRWRGPGLGPAERKKRPVLAGAALVKPNSNGRELHDGCSLVNATKVTEGCGDGHRLPDPDGNSAPGPHQPKRKTRRRIQRGKVTHAPLPHRPAPLSERKTIDVSPYHVTVVNAANVTPIFLANNSIMLPFSQSEFYGEEKRCRWLSYFHIEMRQSLPTFKNSNLGNFNTTENWKKKLDASYIKYYTTKLKKMETNWKIWLMEPDFFQPCLQ